MASFKAKFPVLQELFVKNHPPPSGAGVKLIRLFYQAYFSMVWTPLVARPVACV